MKFPPNGNINMVYTKVILVVLAWMSVMTMCVFSVYAEIPKQTCQKLYATYKECYKAGVGKKSATCMDMMNTAGQFCGLVCIAAISQCGIISYDSFSQAYCDEDVAPPFIPQNFKLVQQTNNNAQFLPDNNPQFPRRGSLGIGLGIPYGTVGINLDVTLVKNLNLSAGIGTTVVAGMGYSVGAKYHFRNINSSWRPRVMAFYGTNGIISTTLIDFGPGTSKQTNERFNGITLGTGQQWTWGQSKHHGIDLDILYILTKGGFDERVKELEAEGYRMNDDASSASDFKVAIGYRYCF